MFYFSAKQKDVDIVEKCIGSFGRWHWFAMFIIFMVKFPVAWHQICIVIEGPPPGNFTCKDPKLSPCDKNCTEHVFDKYSQIIFR